MSAKDTGDALEHWSKGIDEERRSQFVSGVRVESLKTLVGLRPIRTDGSAYTLGDMINDAELLAGFILNGDKPESGRETRSL